MKDTILCNDCNIEQPIDNFYIVNKNKENTRGRWRPYCKKCCSIRWKGYYQNNFDRLIKRGSAYQLKRRRKLQSYILEYLKKCVCIDCGESNPIVLDFDHVRGEKKYAISYIVSRVFGLKLLKEEIEKCDIRCRNCHAIKTAKQRNSFKFRNQNKRKEDYD